jgi:hypothetical protein
MAPGRRVQVRKKRYRRERARAGASAGQKERSTGEIPVTAEAGQEQAGQEQASAPCRATAASCGTSGRLVDILLTRPPCLERRDV